MAGFEADRPLGVFTCEAFEGLSVPVKSFRGHEGLGQLDHYDIVLALPSDQMDAGACLNSAAHLRMTAWAGGEPENTEEKEIHGIVSKVWVRSDGEHEGLWVMTMVPRLWLLTRSTNSRVFQEMSVQEIIQQVCDEAGLDIEFKADSDPVVASHLFRVQYEETNFAFVSRLAEEVGLMFHIDCSKDVDKVIFTDAIQKFESALPMGEIPWAVSVGTAETTTEQVYRLDIETKLMSEQVVVKDYNYEQADSGIEEDSQVDGGSVGTVRMYPGGAIDSGGANAIATVRAEEASSESCVYMGRSTSRSISAGSTIKISPDFSGSLPPFNVDAETLAVVEVDHDFVDGIYNNSFVCVSTQGAYRLPRTTYKPRIFGAQTARVEGHSGEPAMTEQLGRVKVLFHWDTADSPAGETSCWVRVAQTYAGVDHGAYVIPRVGDEVVVVFEEGDPDRPLVVGSVYNSECRMPIDLPSEDHHSVFTTPNGLRQYINDKEGNEEFYFFTPEGKHNIVVEAGQKVNLTAQDEITTVGRSMIHVVADDAIDVKGQSTILIDGAENVDINSGQNVTVNGGQNITLEGAQKITIDGNSEVVIQAAGGMSSIKMDPAGNITIQGMMVSIEASTNLALKGALITIN